MTQVLSLPIIVLAAGASKRMRGRDKLLEIIGAEPLLRRQAVIARQVTNGPVIITLPPPPHPRYDALDALDVSPLPVADCDDGIGASLAAAITALPDGADKAMILLADLPELTAQDLTTVGQAADSDPSKLIWRGASQSGTPGHPIVFDASLFPALQKLSGDQGGQQIIKAHKDHLRLIPLPGDHAICDLDTPEDWVAWRKRQHQSTS